jgi:hypothetical protein
MDEKRRSIAMIAKGFRPVGWVAAVGAAALGCYMLSLRVASERADVARLERKIIAAQQNIRALQTEVGTRGRLTQLEEWNNEVLALAAPVSGQFVEGNVSLARFDTRQPQLDPSQVRLAAAGPPAAAPQLSPAPQPALPAAQHAVATPAPAQPPAVRRASLTIEPEAPRAEAPAAPKPRAAARPDRPRAEPVPTPARARIRVAADEERARPARLRVAADEERARPAPVRAAAAQERSRPAARRASALLNERTVRELGSVARRERGTGN